MTRTVGTNLTTDIESTVSSPRYLVEIVAGANTLRYSTAEDITFSSNTFTKQDIKVQGLELSNGGAQRVTIVVSNDVLFLAVALSDDILDAIVTIWQTGNITRSTDDVVEIYKGTVDHPSIVPSKVSLICTPPVTFSPNIYINAAGGFTVLDGPGKYPTSQGVVVLTRDDG